ncbi:hypothetical protein DV451_004798 [Geotrichum candidum]|uniref:Similar to Saccharomyces cerevisiae YCR010C ADY2 Acetate transporter required for normal sporulation n=1 Tax=Geotrichum candidum TaxID=1173061 RepID=A0A0J9X7N2_GEOCN|nr:hypothetical protein DV451_004798 [Geotrichum candidum]KAI9210513.1 hypothetical protein DS838_004612 [Geotrichum bryndzae]KAF5110451.1 hypothetical protein DV453_000811 [Geotrichum candidum]KAF5111750.1 hypothetical protein DV452_004342 [Geotrichum candidum]KAF5116892.1 hypothetical protein DV454_001420 [Geotrichum candidum]
MTSNINDIDLEKQTADQHSGSSNTYNRNGHRIARVTTSGDDDEILHIGDTKVYKHEFVAAFGGTLNPGLSEAPSRKFANPSPLGLCAFALTTFVLSLVNIHARGVSNPSGVIGLAYFYGGFIQLLAGMWEVVVENSFGATALSSYGGFWLAWAALETKAFGIAEAYDDPADFNNVVGFFLLGWFFFTFIMLMLTLKSTIAFFGLFLFLDITFLFLTISHLGHSPVCGKIGGYFGLITAVIAWYNAYAGIANKENSYFVVKPIYMPGAVLAK